MITCKFRSKLFEPKDDRSKLIKEKGKCLLDPKEITEKDKFGKDRLTELKYDECLYENETYKTECPKLDPQKQLEVK